jgi:hypothetical protein
LLGISYPKEIAMLEIEKGIEYTGQARANRFRRKELLTLLDKLEIGDSVFVPVDYYKQVSVRARVSQAEFEPPRRFICQTSKEGVRVFRVKE